MKTTEIQRGHVLVVDDTPMNLALLGDMLRRRDYIVSEANDGFKALEMVSKQAPELILLDINMPMMSGYEVCRRLKDDPATKDIPVIFISALNDVQDIVKAFEVGGLDYIVKPFQVREVLARVDGQVTLFRQRRELERLREREIQQMSLMDEMRKQFIGSATHDLKNPLALITGYVYLLETHPPIEHDAEAQLYLGTIKRAAKKMVSLVGDMLDLIKLESGVELVTHPSDFGTLVQEQCQDFVLTTQQKSLAYEVTLSSEPMQVALDNDRMMRVVDNLISNAVKYTPEGGKITVSAEIRIGRVCLEVTDTGLGIPEDAMHNLFKPFFRVQRKEHMEIEGTGLGLSIVKRIVEAHKGEIEVESRLGEGTTFRVWLPLAKG